MGIDFRFVTKNNGVVFENDLIQIGIKCEYRQNLGRLCLFYGNKTSFTFTNFVVEIDNEGPLSSHILFECLIVLQYLISPLLIAFVQVSSEGSVPAIDGKCNSHYVSCSKPSLYLHKVPLGAGAI